MAKQPETVEPSGEILIVDDDTYVREFFLRVLEKEGYRCDVAEEGRTAFRLTNRHEYRLVLMDLLMPDWDGIDAIVSMGMVSPNQKVVVVSGRLDEAAVREIEGQPNVIGWIEKPVSADRLLELVRVAFATPDGG